MTSVLKNRGIELGLWVFVLILFSPLLFIAVNSLKDFGEVLMDPIALPKTLQFANYTETWSESAYHRVFLNTVLFAGVSTLIVIVITSMAGYKLSRLNSKGSQMLLLLFTIAIMLPFPVVMIPIAQVAAWLDLKNNLLAISVLNAGFSCSLGVLLFSSAVKAIPRELDECAEMDGCYGYRMFFQIIFPLLKPVTGTLVVIYVIRYWNDLMLPLILITKNKFYTIPLSQMIFFNQFSNNRWNLLLASGVMAVLPLLILYVFTQRYIIQGIVAGAVKG
ncbi:carbohydrate ABC transporter permease [Cohnella caldifontis]|uniref:carbohydrate ABC transporter permease n=1 Tax=Cohnella caldifontis TaxID=3027471 RepID=UPI0023EDD6AD|nr:carbohydrate ABC transporter permease [Cohnella sp. YIM B05605]